MRDHRTPCFLPTASLSLSLGALALLACHEDGDPSRDLAPSSGAPEISRGDSASGEINPRLLRRFKSLSSHLATEGTRATEPQRALGRALYYDVRLSKNHDISCASCHDLDTYGVDAEPTSVGHGGQRGRRNAPSTYHAAGAFAQFWDGREDEIAAQAIGPITSPVEMAMPSPAAAVAVLESIPGYAPLFAAAFPGVKRPITADNIGVALGAFEEGLVTPSRWDAFLDGDERALTNAEKEGFKVFTNVGCMICHTGAMLGGSMFEKVGVVEPWPNQRDQGRFEVTGAKADRMRFKVPSLRNVAMTGPYFHDGSASSLAEAVRLMGTHQVGVELTDSEVDAIETWLGSLTGEIPSDYIRRPTLPPSGPNTPAPDPS